MLRRYAPVRNCLRGPFPGLDIGVSFSKNQIRITDLHRDRRWTVKLTVVQVYELTRRVLIAQLQAHFNNKIDAGSILDTWTEPLASIA